MPERKRTKNSTTYYVSDHTKRQLKDLSVAWGLSISEVLTALAAEAWGKLQAMKGMETMNTGQQTIIELTLNDGRRADRALADWRSPTGYWAAEWDGEQVIPLTDEDGDYIPIRPHNGAWQDTRED